MKFDTNSSRVQTFFELHPSLLNEVLDKLLVVGEDDCGFLHLFFLVTDITKRKSWRKTYPELIVWRKELETFQGKELTQQDETLRELKEKEIKQYGEYRTRRLVFEAWDQLDGVKIGKTASETLDLAPKGKS